MEKLSHSQKSYVNDTMYDDVFGGPPKYGVPTRTTTTTLSPRVDDYSEIFGVFHAPCATSIPVLDLPVVDKAEVFFDVQSSEFDYDEVFGEESNSDFAVSFEELIDQSNGRDNFSSAEAWTPEAEYLSEDLDHSVKDGDSPESVHGSTEFNISYHQVGERGNEDMENGITKVFQPTVPAYASVMDGECSSLQQVDDDCFDNSTFASGERRRERDLRKTLFQPARGGAPGPLYVDEGRPHKGYVRNSSFPNENFLTITDVSIRTRPSQLPLSSRPPPPPALDARQGSNTKSTQDYKWFGSDGGASESSPPSFDEVVGASSDAQASAAAMLEAMEKAEAGMRSAKESMGRKNEVFHNHKYLFQKNHREKYYGKMTRSFDNQSITVETSQGTGERMGDQMDFYAFVENRKLNEENLVISESLEGKRRQTVDKNSEDERRGRESMSSQWSYKIDEASQWKEKNDYFEFASTSNSGKLFDQTSNQDIVKSVLNSSNVEQKSGSKGPSSQNRHGKTYSIDQKSNRSDSRQTGIDDLRKNENIVEDHYQDSEAEDKKNLHRKKKLDWKEAHRSMGHQKNPCEYEDSDNSLIGSFDEEVEEKHNVMHEQMEDERMLNGKIRQEKLEKIEASGWEENKKMRQAYEENNQKKSKETPLKQDGTEGVKEALCNEVEGKEKRLGKTCESTEEKIKKQEVSKSENERRTQLTLEREENENRFKKIFEREGNETRQKDLNSRTEKEMRGRGVFERDFTEARTEENRREIGDKLKEVNEYDRKSKSRQAVQEEEESEIGLRQNPDELGSTLEETINLPEMENLFDSTFESMEPEKPNDKGGDCSLLNEEYVAGIHKGFGGPRVFGGKHVGDEQSALPETEKFPSEPQNDKFEAAVQRNDKTKVENRNGSNVIPDFATQRKQPANEHLEGQNISQTHVYVNHGDKKGGFMSSRVVKASAEHVKNTEPQAATLEVKEISQEIPQHACIDNSNERKVKSLNETSEGKEAEKIRREKKLEHLRKMEEEIEREREKDRMDFDRTEREARERAERAAVERAMNEARQRLEKTSAEARLKAEWSAVERAAADTRERALKVMAERDASKEREKVERIQDNQYQSAGSFDGSRYAYSSNSVEGESAQRRRARLERQRRTAERAEKALAEKTKRDLLAQNEQAERNRIAETLDADVKRWSCGKEGNLRALLSTLQYILGPNSNWQPIPLTEVITSAAVKKAYMKAMLCVHPDKLLQRGASIQQKYICGKVFDLLKEAWNKFNSEER